LTHDKKQGCHIFVGTIYQKGGKCTKLPQNIQWLQNVPNGRKIDEMSIKYTNIFHCKTRQKFTQIAIFGLKIYHLASPTQS
jgi:hypothetical protein